jgi:hypothetical protein
MRDKISYVATLLTAGAAVCGIAAPPLPAAYIADKADISAASAAPSDRAGSQQSCASSGGAQTICQSPGNVQIYDSVPQRDYYSYTGGVI